MRPMLKGIVLSFAMMMLSVTSVLFLTATAAQAAITTYNYVGNPYVTWCTPTACNDTFPADPGFPIAKATILKFHSLCLNRYRRTWL